MDLFADNDAPTAELKINEHYAARFTHNRRRAELDALREKYGDAAEDELDSETDSEDDETEDEDGEQVTADVDAALLRTLAKIRNRDAGIYDSSKRIFDSEHEHVLAKAPKVASKTKEDSSKQKRMTLQDYQRQRVEELIKTSADPAKALADATTNPARQLYLDSSESDEKPKTHVQEQEDLRKQVTAAFHDADAEDEGDDFFKPRGAGGDADADGEGGNDSYREYLLSAIEGDELDKAVRDALKDRSAYEAIAVRDAEASEDGKEGKVDKVKKEKGKKRKRKTKEEEDEDFLMNYVLNRGWVDAPSGSSSAPLKAPSRRPADEPSTSAPASQLAYGRDWEAEAAELESEDSFDSRAEAFETAYNFRFESIADGSAPATVQSFARSNQLKDSVRREDDSRKKKREERKARKEAEKQEKMAELERYRSLQKEEIRDRVRRILKEAGAEEEEQFAQLDLDGDFDPDTHDRAMSTAFNQSYYASGEGVEGEEDDFDAAGEDDDGKPVWDDDIDIDDILAQEKAYAAEAEATTKDKKSKKKEKKKAKNKQKALERQRAEAGEEADDDAFKEEGDDDEMDVDRLPSSSMVKLPEIDEEELKGLSKEERKQKVQEMVDKFHELDYEDMIGDMPTRFKYASVPKSNYGLTAVEILMADDKDLNEVVGLRMLQPYRKGGAQQKRPADLGRRLREFRSKLAVKAEGGGGGSRKRIGGADGEGKEKPKTKRKGKKERMKMKALEGGQDGGEVKKETS
ncbi:Kinetochore protein Spc24 [Tilletia horrida]|nr:Kinetochore protein Spc24 [Tilletia horrida]